MVCIFNCSDNNYESIFLCYMVFMIASDFIACFMASEVLSAPPLLTHKGEHFQLKNKNKTKEIIGQVAFLKIF